MAVTMTHSIEIARPPGEVYAYITQPWRWHEWHPSSRSASEHQGPLGVGDAFDEVIEVQPLAPLPLTLRRDVHYRVLDAVPGSVWQVRGEYRDGWLSIRYELEPTPRGTRFARTLTFDARGPTRSLVPLLASRQAVVSVRALQGLRDRLERAG